MSSHPYVTQQNTPLADDTTLMSTTDLQSYITHANDTFVQVSGYTLQELQGQPHNMVRHPDMPKAAFADMWFTLKKGEPWSGIVKIAAKMATIIGCGPMRYRWCAREKSVAICRFVPGRRMKRSRRWSRCTKR